MDYSQLSDRDIDALVLQKIYGSQSADKDIMRSWLKGGFKFTSNPADAWPIIVENKISLHAPVITKTWMAEFTGSDDGVNDGFYVEYYDRHNENPLRAAMIVFLMMQDANNA